MTHDARTEMASGEPQIIHESKNQLHNFEDLR